MPRQLQQQQQQQQQQQHWPHPATLAELALTSPSPWRNKSEVWQIKYLACTPRCGGCADVDTRPKRVIQKPVMHEKPITAVRTRTSWPVPILNTLEIFEHDSSSDFLKAIEPAHFTTKTNPMGRKGASAPARILLSPTLHADIRALDLGSTTLRIARSDSDTSSSATGTSFNVNASAEEKSPGKSDPTVCRIHTRTPPPAAPPVAFTSAPASAPSTSNTSVDKLRLFEGGFLMAARHLQAIFRSGAADGEQAKEERRLREERVKMEEETGKEERSSCEKEGWVVGGGEARGNGEDRPGSLIYNYGGNSNPSANVDKAATVRRPPIHAPGTLRGTQSALELYRWTRVDHIFLSVHVHVHISGDYFRCRVFIYVHWETSEYPLFVCAPSSSFISSAPRSQRGSHLQLRSRIRPRQLDFDLDVAVDKISDLNSQRSGD
ncbi:hypothetical protein DFH11DRAFT_1884170 [Phellopilus nigrolimitatus]|nr:hypothetical protein DFH11DRAFT_1884170 [Phellopilus nigrolimitatus]